jgi:proline iminopeptidase
MLLHAGPGHDHEFFRPWLDPLTDTAQLVYHDYRGNGRSERPVDWATLTPERTVDDIETLRSNLGLGRPVLLGYCIGTYFALLYARTYPERVRGLILCSGAPTMDFVAQVQAELEAWLDPEELACLQRIFTATDLDDESFRQTVLGVLRPYFHRMPPEIPEIVATRMRFSAGAWMTFRDRYLFTYSVLDWLHEVRVPTLVLSGALDRTAPVGPCARRLARFLPDARLHLFEACGHAPFIEVPEQFNEAVRGFLASLSEA